MYDMKIVMDSDCLIKLTKAGLKEDLCGAFSISITGRVHEEVVERGRDKGRDDAFLVEENIAKGRIRIERADRPEGRPGEAEAVALFLEGGFDAIGSDDRRFLGKLRISGIPYVTPAVCVALLAKERKWKLSPALSKLESLSPWISDEEYRTVKLFLERGGIK